MESRLSKIIIDLSAYNGLTNIWKRTWDLFQLCKQ